MTRKRILICLSTALIFSTATLLLLPVLAVADNSQAPKSSSIWLQDPWTGETTLTIVPEPDTSLWNGQRIVDYQESLKVPSAPPLGVLTIKSLNIRVPIYNGTDDTTLDRGAGRIKGMAKMDEDGNLGISGHRDGFFRGLKDIKAGDDILIQSAGGVERYAVTNIKIVPKSDVSVLAKTDEKALTLVTCYPFYHVGHAPERYIVTALPTPDLVE